MNRAQLPAVWAGPEAAFLRVRGEIRDQLTSTGHAHREGDLEHLASLGVTAVRQPVLWGWGATGLDETNWRRADRRLGELRSLGLEPIVGLLHHGAGPEGRTLLDADFPTAFAAYARRVAERYPWIETWLPVNEPTTTARFAGLYGWWDPAGQSSRAFAAILINQCRGIRAAIRAIREVTPGARLVVNEDVGRTYSTPALRRQAEFDSERRWVALDLLTGRLRPDARLWRYLAAAGQEDAVRDLVEDPQPPDIIGLDYYITSDRFLDERLDRYPEFTRGGNGRQAYADVEVVRVDPADLDGWSARIAEAADRYALPLALTEVSLSGDAHDRCAWFQEAWRAACDSRARGIDVRGVTAWAAFGATGWDRLLVDGDGSYEPGVFDTSSGEVAATPLAETVRAAAAQAATTGIEAETERAVANEGWWRRPSRLLYPAA